jgi:hypothetical protein
MPKIAFIGPAYQARSISVDGQECVNLYPEINNVNSKSVQSLVGTPGYTLFTTMIGNGICRGLYVTSSGRCFGVCGNTLNELRLNNTCINRGTIGTIVGEPVTMDENGNQLLIADGRFGYVFDLINWQDASTGTNHIANTLAKIPTGDVTISGVTVTSEFPKATHVVFKDGYFVANNVGTGQVFVSRAYDGMTWDASLYQTAEGSPDKLLSIIHTNNELWLFGDNSTEVWYTTGQLDFPFQRISGAFTDVGTDAKYSPASNGSIVFWLGSNNQGHGTIWMSSGFNPQKISTHAIEYLIGQMPRVDDAIGWCYQQEGHSFYVLTFPTGNRTFCFDLSTGLWHERGSWDNVNGQMNAYSITSHALWGQSDLVGDSTSGKIYKLSLNVYTDNGKLIRRVRTFPHIHQDRKRLFFRELEIDMQKGVALQEVGREPYALSTYTGNVYKIPADPKQDAPFNYRTHGAYGAGVTPGYNYGTTINDQPNGSDPHIALQMSNDGGYTWGKEYWHGTGKVGRYGETVSWHRLGYSDDRVFKVIFTAPVACIFIAAHADIAIEA